MKRREFLKTGAVAAGLAGSLKYLPSLNAAEGDVPKAPGPGAPTKLTPEYLQRARSEPFLPKLPERVGATVSPMPLAERVRRKIVPQRGFCSIAPDTGALISGNGAVNIELAGDPYDELIPFRHENLFVPPRRPFETPNISSVLPQVRQMLLEGKYHDAAKLAYDEWRKTPMNRQMGGSAAAGGFSMRLEFPSRATVSDYLRTVDFESTELKIHWTDARGDWVRRTFTSRPDDVVVQWLTPPKNQTLDVRITVSSGGGGARGGRGGRGGAGGATGGGNTETDFNEQRLIYKGRLDPSANNRGYAGITRVVRDGGSARMDGNTLVIENASSVLLLTRVAYFPDYSEDQVESVRMALERLDPNYEALLERARKVQSEMLNRVTVDFGGAQQYGMSSEELLSDQRSSGGFSPGCLEKVFEMCRYWFILTSGKYCSMSALTNININLQIAPMALGDHREGEDAYFNWMESLAPDFRTNAKNVFGMRGTHYAIAPTKESGVITMFDHAGSAATGETWPHPYWVAAGGWCVRPFWDHYLVSGDLDFLRKRVVPAYKELALFFEDFLTLTDENGNYIFVPSFSAENNPGNLNPSCMMAINASMDIAVCREVLANLVQACELLGIEGESLPKWKAILAKLPPYLLEPDGALKEWAWPTLAERYVHRHISHLYGAWPGDEIDPDRTPVLAKAALIANRHRVPERLAAHGLCHRALVGARLKDSYMVDSELRQLIEQGFVGPTLRCSHDPYSSVMPDAQGGIPTIMMEMLAYARPGVIEILPALPPSLVKGSIRGMMLHTFARLDKLAWDMESLTADVTITAAKLQDITFIARQGIEAITAPSGIIVTMPKPGSATCELRLPEGKPVEMKLKLGRRNPLDWVNWVG